MFFRFLGPLIRWPMTTIVDCARARHLEVKLEHLGLSKPSGSDCVELRAAPFSKRVISGRTPRGPLTPTSETRWRG